MIPYQCALRRRMMQERNNGYRLNITGEFSSEYGYVTVNGQKYTSEQSLAFDEDTTITVYVGGPGSQLGMRVCNITFNEETVLSVPGSYSFQLTANATVKVSQVENYNRYYKAEITMPA